MFNFWRCVTHRHQPTRVRTTELPNDEDEERGTVSAGGGFCGLKSYATYFIKVFVYQEDRPSFAPIPWYEDKLYTFLSCKCSRSGHVDLDVDVAE